MKNWVVLIILGLLTSCTFEVSSTQASIQPSPTTQAPTFSPPPSASPDGKATGTRHPRAMAVLGILHSRGVHKLDQLSYHQVDKMGRAACRFWHSGRFTHRQKVLLISSITARSLHVGALEAGRIAGALVGSYC